MTTIAAECTEIIKKREFSAVAEFLRAHEVPPRPRPRLSHGLGFLLSGTLKPPADLGVDDRRCRGAVSQGLSGRGVPSARPSFGRGAALPGVRSRRVDVATTRPPEIASFCRSMLTPKRLFWACQTDLCNAAVLAMPHIESLLVDIISGGAVLASGISPSSSSHTPIRCICAIIRMSQKALNPAGSKVSWPIGMLRRRRGWSVSRYP